MAYYPILPTPTYDECDYATWEGGFTSDECNRIIELGELSDEETQSNSEDKGVRVLQVMPSSPAYRIIFRGDIITRIKSGNTSFDINSIQDFESSLKSFDTGDIILIIGTREGTNIFEPVEIE